VILDDCRRGLCRARSRRGSIDGGYANVGVATMTYCANCLAFDQRHVMLRDGNCPVCAGGK
jgi:hypothetical protein